MNDDLAQSVRRLAPPDLSVIIPAYNESCRLAATLERTIAWLEADARSFEILVVDDGSDDRTAAIAGATGSNRVRVLRLPTNRGKGAAVRAGVQASLGAAVLICDADLSTPIEELRRLEPFLDEAQIIIGSRNTDTASILEPQSGKRIILGRLFNWMVQRTTLAGIKDTQCGFKLIDGPVARQLFNYVDTDGFAFDVELLWLARRIGYSISEVGVVWRHDQASRVRPLRDGISMLIEILRFRLRHASTSLDPKLPNRWQSRQLSLSLGPRSPAEIASIAAESRPRG